MSTPHLTAVALSTRRPAFTRWLPDTLIVQTLVQVDDGEGGVTQGTPTTQGPYACRFWMAGANERLSDGQAVQEGTPLVATEALTPVDLNDRIVVTVAETGEQITLSVRGFSKVSNEAGREIMGALVVPQDLT